MGVVIQEDALWQAVLGEIELSLSRGNFVTWFKNTTLIKQQDGKAVIGVTNVFIRQQLEKKYNDLIIETLNKNGVSVRSVEYKMAVVQKSVEPEEPITVNRDDLVSHQQTLDKKTSENSLSHSYRQGLNERYTFENFIVGAGNELAFAACQAVAQLPGSKYNPLFLYGGVGIGKTHLIQAVGNILSKENPKAKVLYISTEQFVQEFVDALRFRKTTDFTNYYRGADVLIVDDVQFIGGKEKVQEEFFHTFNALHQANKQIIISSDKPPRDIEGLEDRLKSRFAGGMSIDMQIPDYETRCAIIHTKAGEHGAVLPQEVIEFLANNIQTNIRELEGAINRLLAFCEVREIEPTLAVASSLLGSSKNRPKHLSAKQIVERTARYFQIPMDEILGSKRDKDIVVPRQIAMYLLRSELKLSYPKIAKELGRKDHTTALHSVDKVDKELAINPLLQRDISEIKDQLYV